MKARVRSRAEVVGVELARLEELARQLQFSHIGPLNMQALVPNPAVREMCAADRCSKYDKSWSCPPACGSVEQFARKFTHYREGLLVQTTGDMEDDFDMDAIRATERIHSAAFDTLARQARMLERDCLPLSAGTCTRCKKCTYPTRPCRYPNRLFPSMEACGLWVSDVCQQSGLAYNYGAKTITFTACILIGYTR